MAQPKSIDAEARRGRRYTGASVDCDHLASRYLAGAIESSAFDVSNDATPELYETSAPPHDEPLIGILGAFDDDERWRKVARTGRAL